METNDADPERTEWRRGTPADGLRPQSGSDPGRKRQSARADDHRDANEAYFLCRQQWDHLHSPNQYRSSKLEYFVSDDFGSGCQQLLHGYSPGYWRPEFHAAFDYALALRDSPAYDRNVFARLLV